MNTPSNFISLESIQIATPCRADWDKMTGDDQARFCASCAKNVYNFDTMTRAQAEQLILEKEGHLCVRLHRRADGTVLTSDCGVGVSPVKRSAGVVRGLMAAVVAAIFGVFGFRNAQAQKIAGDRGKVAPSHLPMTTTMGEPIMTHTMGIVAPTKVKPRPKPVPVKASHPKKPIAKKKTRR